MRAKLQPTPISYSFLSLTESNSREFIHVISFTAASVLFKNSIDQLLPCWVAVSALMLLAPGPPHSVEQSRDLRSRGGGGGVGAGLGW